MVAKCTRKVFLLLQQVGVLNTKLLNYGFKGLLNVHMTPSELKLDLIIVEKSVENSQ